MTHNGIAARWNLNKAYGFFCDSTCDDFGKVCKLCGAKMWRHLLLAGKTAENTNDRIPICRQCAEPWLEYAILEGITLGY